MKIGTDAWMIDASPESIRVSPHESSQNGSAVLISPMTTSHASARGTPRRDTRLPSVTATKTTSAIAARPDAAEHERRRRHVAHGDLDEHERAAPDHADRREQQQVADRRALVRAAAEVRDRAHGARVLVAGAGTCLHPRRAEPARASGGSASPGSRRSAAGFVGWRHDQVSAHDVPHHRSRSQPRVLRGARVRVPPRDGHRPRRRASRRRTTSTASPTSSRSWS